MVQGKKWLLDENKTYFNRLILFAYAYGNSIKISKPEFR